MADIKNWSSTAAANGTTGNPPDWAKENMDKSDVNDVIRQNMKAVRDWYEDPSWIEVAEVTAETWTFAQQSTTVIRMSGDRDLTGTMLADRRIRINGSVLSFIASSSYNASPSYTDVTIDDATVPATVTSVEVASIALADSAFTPLGTAGATLVTAANLGTPIGQTLPLGDAATKTIGSGAGQVGTWGTELGTAAAKDHGNAVGDVALQTDTGPLLSGAYTAALSTSVTFLSANQSMLALGSFTTVNITDWQNISFPGTPDGTKAYEIEVKSFWDMDPLIDNADGWLFCCVGTNGDENDENIFHAAPQLGMSRLLEAVSQLEVSLIDPLDVERFDASNPSGFYENLTGTQDYLTTVLHGRGVCQPGASDLVSVHWYQESAAPDDHNLYQGQGPAVSYLLIRELT